MTGLSRSTTKNDTTSSLATLGGVSLPLLSSLSNKTTKPIVQSLLQQCQAQSTIRLFLKRKLKGIKSSSLSLTSLFPHTVPLASTHFLFQALKSSSLQIRQTAVEILLEAVESPQQMCQLSHIIWDICRDDMVAFQRGMTHCGFIQLYGLLLHYILSSETDNNDLFYTFLVKQDILQWLSRHALEMVTTLMKQENHVSSSRSFSRSTDSLDSNGTVELNQDEVKDRLYIIINVIYQLTCVATKSEWMERHTLARNYLWRRSASHQEGTTTAAAAERKFDVYSGSTSISPLANLLALLYILKNKGSMSLMGNDTVLIPDERVEQVVLMLVEMVDIHGQVKLILEPKHDESEKDKKEQESVNDSPNRRSRDEGTSTNVFGRSSDGNRARRNLEDSDPTSSNPPGRILQLISGTSSRGTENHDRAIIGSRTFSSAAEVMNRTMSFLDRNSRDSEDDGDRRTHSSSRMVDMMNVRLLDGDQDNDDDDDIVDSDNDEHDQEENQSQDTEGDDRASEDEIEEDDDEDDEEEHHLMHQDMHDEEIFSDMEHGGDEAMLDNIIVEVASAPYRDEMMILDDIRRDRDIDILDTEQSQTAKNLEVESSSVKGIDESTKAFRSEVFLRANVEVLEAQYPAHNHNKYNCILTPAAEQCLLKALCDLVKPPKVPLKLKVFMRRAPTQEEFFRGSLSRNPILISSLSVHQGSGSIGSSEDDASVRDLRQHIANDLQMADSAELLELLVAGKILDMNLKLRVVAQTIWRSHVLENSENKSYGGSELRSLLSGAVFRTGSLTRPRVDENSPMSDFPPMVVTYRLAGVDGEATEDKVEESDLVDPDAPLDTANLSSIEYEQRMEKEYGLTRAMTKGRGIGVLLHSLGYILGDTMKRIRRDDVRRSFALSGHQVDLCNLARSLFLKNPPCSALVLLRHCAMIKDNRKKLIKAQAPVVFLRLLLEVLNSINDPVARSSSRSRSISLSESNETSSKHRNGGSNPTSEALQELIEILASDISDESSKKAESCSSYDIGISDIDFEEEESESSMLLLLSSLRTTSLSPPLRKVIAKLLPFLTYGQLPQSKALASQFIINVPLSFLRNMKSVELDEQNNDENILIGTFIDAACHLPPTAVCDTLRSELIRQGFVADMRDFILEDIPSCPPPWSPALLKKDCNETEFQKLRARDAWKTYYGRNGLQIVFKILIGLSMDHDATQSFLSDIEVSESKNILKSERFITACHWIESTSDKDDIFTNNLGILAEELLDTLLKGNSKVAAKIDMLRKATRERKKEIAQERRNKALSVMTFSGEPMPPTSIEAKMDSSVSFSGVKLVGGKRKREKTGSKMNKKTKPSAAKPAWMLEMEAIEDEKGLVCAICQEGRTYKPKEMLGLYAYVKKISISYNKGGGKSLIDGTSMILSLPSQLPKVLQGTDMEEDWYNPSISLAALLKSTMNPSQIIAASGSSMTGTKSRHFTITVTAGNSVHCNCHERARIADRNHPKAPKTEWEGASLRNSRVSCNAILPLISKENSQIPVMSLERALHNYQSVTTNILGSEPDSMMWNILYDLNFLLLRIAYGEPLNNDCGGGSLTSNSALIFYNLLLIDTVAKNSEHDSPLTVQHARELSTCFLAASSILRSGEMGEGIVTKKLRRGFIESSLMSSICCILFKNITTDFEVCGTSKMRWELYKNHFLAGILQCAGRRHALGIESSGCVQPNSKGRARASSFSEWDFDGNLGPSPDRRKHTTRAGPSKIEIYSKAIRPMVTFYAIVDQLSKMFSLEMNDQDVETSVSKLVGVVQSCYNSENVSALLSKANISLDHTTIIEEIEIGINSVY